MSYSKTSLKDSKHFEGFTENIDEVSAFRLYLDVYIISLKSGHVVRYDPGERRNEFRHWLLHHKVREV
jgi:hypothetical protein